MNSLALHRIDAKTWIAMACIAFGWFGLNTLEATFGPLRHVAHFYDLPAIMTDPRWLLRGVSDSHTFGTVVFAFVCLLVIASPLLPRLGYPRTTWLNLLPLALMLLCSIVLYVKSSSTHIEAGDGAGKIGEYLARWANGAVGWTGDVISRHIAVGAGGYLSFLASGWLAAQGVLELRAARENGRITAQ
jgi:hypothetical protein